MGRAIQVTDLSFTTNLGKITIISGGDIPEVIEIAGINIVSKPSTIQDSIQLSISYVPSNTTRKRSDMEK